MSRQDGSKRDLADIDGTKRWPHYGVLKALSLPFVQPDSDLGWQLVFFMGAGLDYTIPFRQALYEITSLLEQTKPTSLDLPPYDENEDFVEGEIHHGGEILSVYFEYSLGYLKLGSDNASTLDEVLSQVREIVAVTEPRNVGKSVMGKAHDVGRRWWRRRPHAPSAGD